MSRSPDDPSVVRTPPVSRQYDIRSLVRQLEGKDYNKPIAVYRFSTRTFYEEDKRNLV